MHEVKDIYANTVIEYGSAIKRLWKKGERGKIVRNKNRGEKDE